jgi:hypothetical protein
MSDLESIFTDDPLHLTREDIIATLPAWRALRAKVNLSAPAPQPAKKKVDLNALNLAPKKTLDLSALGLMKK